MNPSPSKDLLHVFLLTYNREKSFRRTLDTIAASPLKEFRLTIMDNCSTDATPAVCEEFRLRLPRMEILRHPRNIGSSANFLRAVELSQGEYTWILCDDDTLFPERFGCLLDLLRNARPEACFVGGPRQEEWPSGLNISPADIQCRFHTFLTAQSFLPSLVFKSSLIGSAEILDGYVRIHTHFSQFVIGRKLLLDDIPCAVIHPPLLERNEPSEKTTTYLDIVDGWSHLCRTLPPALRQRAFYSIFEPASAPSMITHMLRMTLWAKVEGVADPAYHIASIGLNVGSPVRVQLLICRLACLLPAGLFNFARETYRKFKYDLLRKPLPSGYHKPITRDELRR